MATIAGSWFAPGDSTRRVAELSADGEQYALILAGSASPERRGSLAELSFSERVGDIPRRVSWPDGALLETTDNAGVDALLGAGTHRDHRSHWMHQMERSTRWALLSLLIAVCTGFAFFRWGLPAVAAHVARSLPVSAHEAVATGAMEALDRVLFDESTLDVASRQAIERRFETLLAGLSPSDFRYTLHFRRLQDVPNAMALPGGDIVLTDAFVELAGDPHEIDAVLLHEIGHVEHRHAMQQLVQASAVSVIMALALGDTSGLADLVSAVPGMLLQRGYSRVAEADADDFAFARMVEAGIDPRHFARIIERLGSAASDDGADNGESSDSGAGGDSENGGDRADAGDRSGIGGYLATHPATAERARRAIAYAERNFDTLAPATGGAR